MRDKRKHSSEIFDLVFNPFKNRKAFIRKFITIAGISVLIIALGSIVYSHKRAKRAIAESENALSLDKAIYQRIARLELNESNLSEISESSNLYDSIAKIEATERLIDKYFFWTGASSKLIVVRENLGLLKTSSLKDLIPLVDNIMARDSGIRDILTRSDRSRPDRMDDIQTRLREMDAIALLLMENVADAEKIAEADIATRFDGIDPRLNVLKLRAEQTIVQHQCDELRKVLIASSTVAAETTKGDTSDPKNRSKDMVMEIVGKFYDILKSKIKRP